MPVRLTALFLLGTCPVFAGYSYKGIVTFPAASGTGTDTNITLAVDTGTATIKTWKIATGTVSNTLSTSGVSISSGIFGFNLYAVSSATQINFILECDQ